MSDPQENGPKPVKGVPLAQGGMSNSNGSLLAHCRFDAKLGPENPGVRQEFRDLQKNGDLWNLYLLGLSELQRKDSNNSLSYFQIASMWR